MKSQITFFSLGTVNTLLAYGPNATVALGKVQKRIEEIDDAMSVFKDDSIVSKINQQAGISPVVVPKDIFDVLSCSQEIANASGGAFDVTVRPLSQSLGLWHEAEFHSSG
jgi:thiamine biosynthesis lipoprotein